MVVELIIGKALNSKTGNLPKKGNPRCRRILGFLNELQVLWYAIVLPQLS